MEDEKATGSWTPPPTPRGVWLKLSPDLETQWRGGAGLGGGAAQPGEGAMGGRFGRGQWLPSAYYRPGSLGLVLLLPNFT